MHCFHILSSRSVRWAAKSSNLPKVLLKVYEKYPWVWVWRSCLKRSRLEHKLWLWSISHKHALLRNFSGSYRTKMSRLFDPTMLSNLTEVSSRPAQIRSHFEINTFCPKKTMFLIQNFLRIQILHCTLYRTLEKCKSKLTLYHFRYTVPLNTPNNRDKEQLVLTKLSSIYSVCFTSQNAVFIGYYS